MTTDHRTIRSQRRLAEELEDDHVVLPAEDGVASVIVEELDYARSAPL